MSDTDIQAASKAAAEASKFGTKALETTDKILSFIAKVFNEPAKETSGMLGDSMKFYRWKRQIRIVDKVNKILEDRGTEKTIPIPPKFAIPILQNASLEDEDNLQDIWIRLISNSMDPDFEGELRFAFIEIIKSLNSLDASILDFFYKTLKANSKIDWDQITNYSLTKEQICKAMSLELKDYYVSIHNLFRVQCFAPAILKGGVKMGNESLTVYKGADAITLTPLGKNFIEMCISDN